MKLLNSKTELCICLLIWTIANIYALYMLIKSQTEILEADKNVYLSLDDLQPGWKLFSRYKDVSDIEWSICLDFSFHFIYFYAIQNDIELVRKMSSIALCGGGLWMGLEFYFKYVISYGTTGSFAMLDNIEAPPTPRCIARIHIYSQMWRHFDVGLYRFLVKYIYKPSYVLSSEYINLPKIAYKLLASLGTFLFIFMWHGMVWHILMWSFLNYVGILMEHVAKIISESDKKCPI
ncbi:unnamed protein product [Pieris brassicae]|uniref:Protein-cysteine N-palmitoyltransferase Rasp n=1 Tax=Pieris brassicae TaxID=7116 RepID=A0A9P0XAV9_PIEBR|nr:unnamed protein product [Pieris brassicae]